MQVDFEALEVRDAICGIKLNFPYPAKDAYTVISTSTRPPRVC